MDDGANYTSVTPYCWHNFLVWNLDDRVWNVEVNLFLLFLFWFTDNDFMVFLRIYRPFSVFAFVNLLFELFQASFFFVVKQLCQKAPRFQYLTSYILDSLFSLEVMQPSYSSYKAVRTICKIETLHFCLDVPALLIQCHSQVQWCISSNLMNCSSHHISKG